MTIAETTTPTNKHPSMAVTPLDVTVLAGGPGAEREVSLNSGRAVFEALQRLGHRVILRDIGPDDFSALEPRADVIFIALHGEFGEDGTLQAELDARGLSYCGSGAAASRLAMHKLEAKRRFERAGIPTPLYEVANEANLAAVTSRFQVPAVVKPIACGSSVDTTIARSADVLQSTVSRLVEEYGEALVERYIDGPELTVGIVGDRALPVCEIRTQREFYNYEAKYLDNDTQYLFDLELPQPLLRRVQELSLIAHRALGCRAFSRVDWMVDAATQEPYILEINTIPGFTDHSLLPKAAAKMGLSFDRLCQRIIELSLSEEDR